MRAIKRGGRGRRRWEREREEEDEREKERAGRLQLKGEEEIGERECVQNPSL